MKGMKYTDAIRAHSLGDVLVGMIEQPWANAALPRVTGLVGKPEPVSRLGPDGRPSLSQEGRK